jgi:putative DNA primase/helicase
VWVKRHGENWRYVSQWGAWYEWKGDRWAPEKTSKPFELARNITREALMWDGIQPATRLRVNSAKTAGALLQFVKSDRKIAATIEQWDTHTMLMGVPGGVVDLTTGTMRPAVRDEYMTKQAACSPALGEATRWLKFLERITYGDADITSFLHRFAGYCLTGETSEHALAFLYGTGANGKTTFVQALLGILGDYAITAPIETFAETKSERHSTELARLRGARMVATEETSTGSRWNEGRIKTLTGGNRISARFMRQDDFEYQPEFKLLIAGNHKPQMRSVDEAIKRRMHIVPFTVTIPEYERDHTLQSALREEWPQILQWVIDGCKAWRAQRLSPPKIVKDATDTYLQSNDTLGAWLDECCELDGYCDGKTLYKNYAEWCAAQGEPVWSRRGWSDAMIDRGFANFQRRIGGVPIRGFNGVKLRLSAVRTSSSKFND